MSTLLDATALGERLGATAEQVKIWHRYYRWPHVKLGREIRWTPEQADEIVRRQSVTHEGATVVPADGRTRRSQARRRSA